MASPSSPEATMTPAILVSAFLPSEGIASLGSLQGAGLFSPPTISASIRSSSSSAVDAASTASSSPESTPCRTSKRTRSSKPPGSPPSPVRKRARAVSLKKDPIEDEDEDKKPAATETCCICMSDVEVGDLAKINSCDHRFCFSCIEKWAERENSCPLCKVRFTKIERLNKSRRKGQTNTKKVKKRDQRSDLPGAALEGLLASLARRGSSSSNVARLIFSGSTIALGVRGSGRSSFPSNSQAFLTDMFGDSDEDETPFSAFLRAFHNAPPPPLHFRPVTVSATVTSRSYASNSNETTAGNQENPLTIDDDSANEEEVVEVVGVRTVTRRRV